MHVGGFFCAEGFVAGRDRLWYNQSGGALAVKEYVEIPLNDPKRQTVCLLNDSFPPVVDGVANTVVNYGRVIERELGHAIVLTPDVKEADDSAFSFPVYRYPSLDTTKMFGYVTGLPVFPELRRKVLSERPSVLHSHCPAVSQFYARELREKLDAPVIFTYHTKFDIEIQRMVRLKLIQDSVLRALVENVSASDEVWVVSEGAGQNLRSIGYEGEYHVMRNGCDVEKGRLPEERIRHYTEAYDLPEGVPVFLFVGRMQKYKGQMLTLDALRIVKDHGTDFRMVFIGDGADLQEIKDHAEELGLSGKVIFTGTLRNREAIRAFYGRADLFLFPSSFDTNGLVVTEAAGSGTASILLRKSPAAETVTDGVNAFLIDENADSMAEKLLELTAHPERIREAGKRAEEELYYSWDDSVRTAWERYQTVIENYHSGHYPKHDGLVTRAIDVHGSFMDGLIRLTDLVRRVKDLDFPDFLN